MLTPFFSAFFPISSPWWAINALLAVTKNLLLFTAASAISLAIPSEPPINSTTTSTLDLRHKFLASSTHSTPDRSIPRSTSRFCEETATTSIFFPERDNNISLRSNKILKVSAPTVPNPAIPTLSVSAIRFHHSILQNHKKSLDGILLHQSKLNYPDDNCSCCGKRYLSPTIRSFPIRHCLRTYRLTGSNSIYN